MSGIDNTSKRMQEPDERLTFLLDALAGGGQGAPIERMERDGQQQLVNSDRLPTRFNSGAQAAFEALGFTFGDPDPADPLFRPATLPPGWSRKGSDHAMWSYITDEHGRDRVSIFYKAAFYDRDAFMNLVSLGSYVAGTVEYDGGPIVFDEKWATPEAVRAEMERIRDAKLAEAADFRRYAADVNRRDEQNRVRCAETAERYEAEAAKYNEALTRLEPQS